MKIVSFPKCQYCTRKTGDVFFCTRCSKYSHWECLVEITDADRCTHKAYEPAQTRDWESDICLLTK